MSIALFIAGHSVKSATGLLWSGCFTQHILTFGDDPSFGGCFGFDTKAGKGVEGGSPHTRGGVVAS